MFLTNLYYSLRPFVPRAVQIAIRRQIVRHGLLKHSHVWPINESAGVAPENWSGWPHGKRFAFVLTHDVDTAKGQQKAENLVKIETAFGFRSSFNFVPRRYEVSENLRNLLVDRGFEVGVHGLYHDGRYYKSRRLFNERAQHINDYLRQWKAVGFRSPSMLHNLEWIHELEIEYDSSTFDTDPFEPQPDGVNTIFPFIVENEPEQKWYVELPYTLPQDFTVFVLLKEKDIDIWKEKLDWIALVGGMALLNTHPDYMNFGDDKISNEEYEADLYIKFLDYVKATYGEKIWHVLPRDMSRYWAGNMKRAITDAEAGMLL